MATLRLTKKWLTICAKSVIFVFDKSANESALIRLKYSFDISPLCHSSPAKENEERDEHPQKDTEPEIVDSSFSDNERLFAVVTSTKHLILYEVSEDWKQFGNVRNVPKAPTKVRFDAQNDVVVGDRSGSLRKFRLDAKSETPEELLGHVSMLLDVCFSARGERVVSVDRDEKLRISRYPHTHVIEAFCLGHTAFINTVASVAASGVVASAGGDSTIRFWNVESGECVFASGKICDAPIRKLCVCPLSKQQGTKLVVLPENSNSLKVFDYNNSSPALSAENSPALSAASNGEEALFDVVFDEDSDSLVCLGRLGIYWSVFGSPTRNLQRIETEGSAQVLALLKACRDAFPLSRLFKAVGFENVKAFAERREEKKSRRKRKHCAESADGDNNGRDEEEEEEVCVEKEVEKGE